MAHVKYNINSLEGYLSALNESVSEINTSLQEHKQHVAGELADLQAFQTYQVQQLNTKIETLALNTSQQTEQLFQLHTSLSSKLDFVVHKQDSTHSKLDSLTATTAQLSSDHQQIQANISHMDCSDTKQRQGNLTQQPEKEQDNETLTYKQYWCGGTGGWRRVVYLNMTDPNTTCPSGWNMTGFSKRTCGRATDGRNTCDSATFPVREGEYGRICGRIRAYQWGSPDAFAAYYSQPPFTIGSAYVDGVSVTHGTPRNHIWTFAAGVSEHPPFTLSSCPCDSNNAKPAPSFVGKDHFCESGLHNRWNAARGQYRLYSDDNLWDGEDCLPNSTCCSRRNPPYFIKQLSNSTTDDIEARICLDEVMSNENIAVELVELYVQ